MKQITGWEFVRLINKNPSWCKDLKEPLEITTYADLHKSTITHLSPLLTFSGEDKDGWVASFWGCKNLEIATGTFKRFVYFGDAAIKQIKDLNITGRTNNGYSALFNNCPRLKVATGTYEGAVNFQETGIVTIKDLVIKNTDQTGLKAKFGECPIKYIPKEYRGDEFLFDFKIKEDSILRDKTIKNTVDKLKQEVSNIEL